MRKLQKVLVFGFSFLLVFFLLLWLNTSAQEETYDAKVVVSGSWGDKPGEFGLYSPTGEESPASGPCAFTVTSSGDLYICDLINYRIQRFDSPGNIVTTIPIGKWVAVPKDITIDHEGNVYLLYKNIDPAQVRKYDQNGKFVMKYPIFKPDSVLKIGVSDRIYIDNSGRIFATGSQAPMNQSVIFQIGTTTEAFSADEQKNSVRSGFLGMNAVTLNENRLFEVKDGTIQLVDWTGKVVKKFKNLPFMESFTGVDKYGNLYTYAQDSKSHIHTIRKYNEAGQLIARFQWKRGKTLGALSMSKRLYLDSEGNVYVYTSIKDGVKITKWSKK